MAYMVYEFQRCDVLPAHKKSQTSARQRTNLVLLRERGQRRHARFGARRLQSGRDEDRSARSSRRSEVKRKLKWSPHGKKHWKRQASKYNLYFCLKQLNMVLLD